MEILFPSLPILAQSELKCIQEVIPLDLDTLHRELSIL